MNKIVLLSDQPEDVSFLAEISQVTKADLKVAKNAVEAAEIIGTESVSAIFIDVTRPLNLNEFEVEAQKRFGLFSDQVHAQKFHFISDRPLDDNRDVINSPFFGSFFERPETDVEKVGQFYGQFVLAGEKMETHDLKHFLAGKGSTQTLTLTNANQKQEAAEAVRQYLIQAKVPARIANVVANSVDELLMNAIYDAPVDDFGKTLYSTTARNQDRELTGRELVKMTIGFDGFHIGITVTDSFGALDRSRILNHVSLSYRNRDYTIRQGQAGAGLGIATIFNSGGSLIYHCEAGVKTEATVLFRAYDNFKEFKKQFRFFSAKFYV